MNFDSIFFTIIISIILGGIGFLLGKKIIPGKFKYSKIIIQIISGVFVILSISTWNLIIKPSIKQSELKEQIEKSFKQHPLADVFLAIKKYDNAKFNEFIEQLVTNFPQKKAEKEKYLIFASQLGTRLSMQYFRNAAPADIYNHLVNYNKMLSALYENQPLFICQLESPEKFGYTNKDDLALENMKKYEMLESFANIIKSSSTTPYYFNEKQAEKDFYTFMTAYKNQYPENVQSIMLQSELDNPENIKKYAKAILSIYQRNDKATHRNCLEYI